MKQLKAKIERPSYPCVASQRNQRGEKVDRCVSFRIWSQNLSFRKIIIAAAADISWVFQDRPQRFVAKLFGWIHLAL